MPYCMVPDCTNGSKSTKGTGTSFHRLPKEKTLAKKWIEKTRRKNPPKRESCYVCSIHFKPECFEMSFKHLLGQKAKKNLKANSIPTIFPQHNKEKRQRLFSLQRELRQDKKEVSMN